MAGGGMGQAMGGYYGAAYGPLGASMAAAAAAAAQQNAISAALTTPNSQVRTQNVYIFILFSFVGSCKVLKKGKHSMGFLLISENYYTTRTQKQ